MANVTPTRDSSTPFACPERQSKGSLGMTGLSSNLSTYMGRAQAGHSAPLVPLLLYFQTFYGPAALISVHMRS